MYERRLFIQYLMNQFNHSSISGNNEVCRTIYEFISSPEGLRAFDKFKKTKLVDVALDDPIPISDVFQKMGVYAPNK